MEGTEGDLGMAPLVPRQWLVFSIRRPPLGEEFLVADAFVRMGGRAVERREGRIRAYFPPAPDPDAFALELESVLRSRTTVMNLGLEWQWDLTGRAPHGASRGARARRVGPRLVIVSPGPDSPVPPPEGRDIFLQIDSGIAFGSGEHGSTRAALRLLALSVRRGDRVLDAGAGSGILSVACARLGAHSVTAADVDPYALASARRNAELNGVAEQVQVRRLDLTAEVLTEADSYDGILANLESDALLECLPGLERVLSEDGWFILSGAPKGERAVVVESAEVTGMMLVEEAVDDGWWAGRFLRA